MQVREATINDKEKWNSFVETEGGSFFHYFEWKSIYEVNNWDYIPLLIENKTTEIIGILPIVKVKGFLYSKLVSLPDGASGGFVFKRDITQVEKTHALKMLTKYIDQNYSKGCSTFLFNENLTLKNPLIGEATELFRNNGFTYRSDKNLNLPCTYRLKLTPSFENDIWEGLWGKYLRNHIRKSQKHGICIKEDTMLQHKDDFMNMLISTYERFGSTLMSKEEIALRLTTFKDKTKLWIAFLDDKPIASLLCYYDGSSLCYASKLGYYDSAREHFATVHLLSETIRDACENGYQFFEFGVTESPSLAQWKEQFKPTKIPMRRYKKKYSTMRTYFEILSSIKWALGHKKYMWNNRYRLLRKLIREGIYS